jgi:hypothetical protein
MNSLADWLWWLLAVYFVFIYLMMLFRIVGDIFRSQDMGGWGKAGWMVFLIFVPILAMLIYVIVRGQTMAERDMAHYQQARAAQDDYIRTVAGSSGSGSAATEIATANDLLKSGAITQTEFEAIKAKALA